MSAEGATEGYKSREVPSRVEGTTAAYKSKDVFSRAETATEGYKSKEVLARAGRNTIEGVQEDPFVHPTASLKDLRKMLLDLRADVEAEKENRTMQAEQMMAAIDKEKNDRQLSCQEIRHSLANAIQRVDSESDRIRRRLGDCDRNLLKEIKDRSTNCSIIAKQFKQELAELRARIDGRAEDKFENESTQSERAKLKNEIHDLAKSLPSAVEAAIAKRLPKALGDKVEEMVESMVATRLSEFISERFNDLEDKFEIQFEDQGASSLVFRINEDDNFEVLDVTDTLLDVQPGDIITGANDKPFPENDREALRKELQSLLSSDDSVRFEFTKKVTNKQARKKSGRMSVVSQATRLKWSQSWSSLNAPPENSHQVITLKKPIEKLAAELRAEITTLRSETVSASTDLGKKCEFLGEEYDSTKRHLHRLTNDVRHLTEFACIGSEESLKELTFYSQRPGTPSTVAPSMTLES